MRQIPELVRILCVCDVRMYMDRVYTLYCIYIYIYIYITNTCTLLYFYTIILLYIGVSNIL